MERRSIQDVIAPARSRPVRPLAPHEAPPPAPPATPPPGRLQRGGGGSLLPLLAIALVVVLVIGVGFVVASTIFHRADISVELHTFSVPVSGSFEAAKDGDLLSFTTLSVTDSQSKSVSKTGTVRAEDAASGTLVVYNAFSVTPQRLIANTRFQSPSGLIYRIKIPLTIPGYTKEGSTVVPGQAEVVVYADEAGEKYNLVTGSFTIPGLKGSPQFETITARTKSPIAGGYVGDRAIIAPAVRDAAIAELRSAADRSVRSKFLTALSGDKVAIPATIQVLFSEEPDRATQDGATITVVAAATAPVFSNQELAAVMAHEGDIGFAGKLVITNLKDVGIAVAPSKNKDNLTVTLTGTAALMGVYDKNGLIAALLTKDRRSVSAVLAEYPAIKDLKVVVYPFWRGDLPNDASKLSVTEVAAD